MTAKKIILFLFALLTIAAVGGWYAWRHFHRHDDEALHLSGNIEATEVGISFKIPGRVIKRLVDEGDKVKRGQLIAVLDTADLEAEVALRRAELAAARAALAALLAGSRPEEIDAAGANMAAARVEKDRLETELGRSRRLIEGKMISQEEYDRAAAAARVAAERYRQASEQFKLVKAGPRKEDIDQGRARVQQAEAALRVAQTQLDYAQVTSPLDGIVLSKNIEPGEYVAPGTPVVTVADMVNVWLRAYVDETDLHDRVQLDQPAEVTVDSLSGKVYEGRVVFIAQEAEFTPKTVQTEKERVKLVYRIKIDVKNPRMELKAGMPADAILRMKDQG
jgi:HlyD family secretion protein